MQWSKTDFDHPDPICHLDDDVGVYGGIHGLMRRNISNMDRITASLVVCSVRWMWMCDGVLLYVAAVEVGMNLGFSSPQIHTSGASWLDHIIVHAFKMDKLLPPILRSAA